MLDCLFNTIMSYFYQKTSETHEINKPNLVIKSSKNKLYSLYYNTGKPNLESLLFEIIDEGIYIDKIKSNIFLYNNCVVKINNVLNIKKYMNIINTINNFKIENVLIPKQIYINNYNKELIEVGDYYPHGDLFDYFYKNMDQLNLDDILNIMNQVVDIVSNLHRAGLAHRDLKLENFVIYYEQNILKIKLIDLDFTCTYNTNLDFKGGTLKYCSYEVLNNNEIENWCSNDIWAIAVMLYIFLFKMFPWDSAFKDDITFNVFQNKYNNTFWEKKMFYLENKHIDIFTKIFEYGFNLKQTERTDINYIKNLLIDLNEKNYINI